MNNESVTLLSQYIQIDTTVPPGNEGPAVDFFADIFIKEGIEYSTYESDPGRASIRAVIEGSGKKGAVILLNHIDVVPADRSEWSFDPFGGEIRDGYIHGRGTMDMKGQGIMELLAFLTMKRKQLKLNRDLIFLATADEEALGYKGVKYLLDNYPDDFQADLVINEGGAGITGVVPGKPLMMIATAEKGPCWLKLSRTGPSGHGSTPHGQNALEKMILALNKLLNREMPLIITPITAEYFKNMGMAWDFLKPFIEDGKDETLIRILKENGLINMPQISAMVKNTISLNALHAGVKTNVIPSYVEAELDIRLLPGQEIADIVKYVREGLADDEIKIDYGTAQKASESSRDTEEYRLIEDFLKRNYPDAIVTPTLMVGTSDSRYFREKGIVSYGVLPMLFPIEEARLIHGVDEKISIENLIKGTEALTELVRILCTD